jgi:mannosyltransferase OCH1-like enzyme|tara:strand:- start:365 stop:1021 length:657 start_codon:yes stop_codon:yes gene_type:complete
MNIEKKMTHIWIGPKAAPTKWMNTWRDMHPDWEYSVFTDEMLWARKWRNQSLIEEYYRRGRYAGAHDLIRYELIYERGGFWPAADSVCLHNTDELFTSPEHHAYTVYESEKAKPGYVSPILAANAGNEVVGAIIDQLHKLQPNQLHNEPFMSTGNAFLAKFLLPFMAADKVTVWPSYTLIPQWYGSIKRYDGPGKVYAEQYFGSTGANLQLKGYDEGR